MKCYKCKTDLWKVAVFNPNPKYHAQIVTKYKEPNNYVYCPECEEIFEVILSPTNIIVDNKQ